MLGSFGKNTGGINAPIFDGTQVCAQMDPDAFFPDNPVDYTNNLRVIRPICNSCRFQTPCLEYALDNPELIGIWAGTSYKDRLAMKRKKVSA